MEYKCSKCKDTGIQRFKRIDGFTHYQWVPWEERPCICVRNKKWVPSKDEPGSRNGATANPEKHQVV